MRKYVMQFAKMPFRDDEIEGLMSNFFQDNIRQGARDTIDYSSFQYALEQLNFAEANDDPV